MPYSLVSICDEKFNTSLISLLKEEFEIQGYPLAHKALERLRAHHTDLIVLNPDLPDMPGMTFLKVLRETEYGRELPVILVSAAKTEDSVAQAFELGVDDYLAHPFDLRELQVRIRAVLRRKYERTEHWGSALTIGPVEIDPSQRRCLVHGKRVSLRPQEFELLEILMRKAGRVLTRPYLLETVWGMSSDADTRAVDVIVSRVRKYLGRSGKMIETISKMGYCFKNPNSP